MNGVNTNNNNNLLIQNYKTTPSDLINDINNHLNLTSNTNINDHSSTITNDINKNYNNTHQITNNDNNNIFSLKKTTKSNNLLSNNYITKDSSNLINNNNNADVAFSNGSVNAMDVNSGPSSIVSNNGLIGFNPTNQNYNKGMNLQFNNKIASNNINNNTHMQNNCLASNGFTKKFKENGNNLFI